MSEEPESSGQRKRVDALQLGPRKWLYVHCFPSLHGLNTSHLAGVLLIHWCTMGAISAEPSMHSATFKHFLPTSFYEWVNWPMFWRKTLLWSRSCFYYLSDNIAHRIFPESGVNTGSSKSFWGPFQVWKNAWCKAQKMRLMLLPNW